MTPFEMERYFKGALEHGTILSAFWEVCSSPESSTVDHESYVKVATMALITVVRTDERERFSGRTPRYKRHSPSEWLEYLCERCGYAWRRPTLDAKRRRKRKSD